MVVGEQLNKHNQTKHHETDTESNRNHNRSRKYPNYVPDNPLGNNLWEFPIDDSNPFPIDSNPERTIVGTWILHGNGYCGIILLDSDDLTDLEWFCWASCPLN
jgi:hypothetical protein